MTQRWDAPVGPSVDVPPWGAIRAVGGALIALGAATLAGWALGVSPLKAVLPGLVAMKVNAALGLMASGLGLLRLRAGGPLFWACVATSTGIGAATALEYLAGVDLGIDQLAVLDRESAALGLPPGRMALSTAVGLSTSGVALATLRARPRWSLPQYLGLALTGLGAFSTVGYVLGERSLYLLSPVTSLALNTAMGFAVLGLATVAAGPTRGPLAGVIRDVRAGALGPRLLVAPVALSLAVSWLGLAGARAGWYSTSFGMVAFAAANALSLSGLAWAVALAGHRDAQRRDRAERAIRASERHFRTLAEGMPHFVWQANPLGDVEYASPAWSAYSGFDAARTAGLGFLDAFHAEDVPVIRDAWMRALARGDLYQVEGRARCLADGSYRWFRLTGLPVRDERGVVERWVGTVTDIDGQRRLEGHRAAALAREQQAREAAEAAHAEAQALSAAKDKFLAMLSHELRTPLNPILLTATAILDDPADPGDRREEWEMVRQNVGLEARLIDDLLDVMRTISGKMPYQFEVVDVHDLIRKTVEIVRSDASAKGIALELDLSALMPTVRADPARLTQAFWNLMKNAVKFTGEGGGIALRTRDEGPRVVVEVVDTGIGIDPAALGKVFLAFEQIEDTVTRRYGGLGLGLTIAKSVVERHGGSIHATSLGSGRGATFTIRLASVALAPSKAEERGRRPDAERLACNLLLVEDDAMTRRVMATLLRNAGHAVTTAASYDEALAAADAADNRFDLVVSDIGLPGRSGLELIRELHGRHGLRCVALTGFGMDEDIQKSHEAGFIAHITKPVDFPKLDELIQRVAAG